MLDQIREIRKSKDKFDEDGYHTDVSFTVGSKECTNALQLKGIMKNAGFDLNAFTNLDYKLKKCLIHSFCTIIKGVQISNSGQLEAKHLEARFHNANHIKKFWWGMAGIFLKDLTGMSACKDCNLLQRSERTGGIKAHAHCRELENVVIPNNNQYFAANAILIHRRDKDPNKNFQDLVCVDCYRVWGYPVEFQNYLEHMIMEQLIDPQSTSSKMGMTVANLV